MSNIAALIAARDQAEICLHAARAAVVEASRLVKDAERQWREADRAVIEAETRAALRA